MSDKIATNAVTSDKIDFTTLKKLGMPVATVTSRALGYKTVGDLLRIGDLVWLTKDTEVVSLSAGLRDVALSETIPSGYRPRSATTFQGTFQDGVVNIPTWRVSTNGSMTLSTQGSAAGSIRFGINAMWLTSDAWPS